MKLNITTLLLGFAAILVVVVRQAHAAAWSPWQIAGFALAAASFLMLVLARIQLGSAFSVQAKASALVTTGLYARIRNPIYVFGGLVIAGGIIWLKRPWWLLVFVVLIPLQMHRARREEQVLEARFGEAYRNYKLRTWF
ncbi:MAG: methyltransferase family protein [Terriglobales bacterium]